MLKKMVSCALLGSILVAAAVQGELASFAQGSSPSSSMPLFEVDASWPRLPNNWVMGIVSAVAVDRRDHVWILHRPRSVQEALKAQAAPPVLEFDADGKFVNAWGGPAAGYDWPVTEHGIMVDGKDIVWIGGSGITDDFLLQFTSQGKFVKEFFGKGRSKGNADTMALNRPADASIDAKTNEVFVADGYGNRRVIVLDADTGAFKRMWGAFGNPPDSAPPAGAPAANPAAAGTPATPPPIATEGPGAQQFGNPVHAVKLSNDGLVYVADRANRRVQVFTPEGKYVSQVFINRALPSQGTAAGLAFSPDPQQQFLYVSDLGNSHILVLNRKTLQELYQFGPKGAKPGEFQAPHLLAVDSKGNLYTAEVNPGNRAQRFVFKGLSKTPPPNALPAQ